MSLPTIDMLEQLRLTRLEPGAPARAAIVSLPVPPGVGRVELDGGTSQSVELAWWPRHLGGAEAEGQPRRLLVTASGDEELPERVSVKRLASAGTGSGQWTGAEWETRVIEQDYTGLMNWEEGELVLSRGDAEIGLRLGLEQRDGTRLWWEWLQAEDLWSGPACRAIRVAGYASSVRLDDDHPDVQGPGPTKWTHRHHWVLCEVVALLFANGVVHVTARHVNNQLYDYGRDVPGRPILGLRGSFKGNVVLEGETVEVDVGGVTLSTEECRTLASAEHPGRLQADGEIAILQPHGGVEITLAGFGARVRGEPYVCTADEWVIPRGVARTTRFCLSFGEAPPRVDRYVVPYFWYGLCSELTAEPLLPVSDCHDDIIDAAGRWFVESQLSGCFGDGSIARSSSHYNQDGSVAESGWEGETPCNIIRYYYRSPGKDTWEAAVRDAYYVADVAADHASFQMRMHGYDYGSISMTMNRTLGMLQAYLETGDPYLLETCENMALRTYAMDTSNWPRRTYGRDAVYARGLVALDDYFPESGYGVKARKVIGHMIQCQRPDGSHAQQGGPGGAHAGTNLTMKPWMNMQLLEPLMDWLERHPEDEEVSGSVRRTADWLLTQIAREGGEAWWPYEVGHGENTGPAYQPGVKYPVGRWRVWYPARTMLFATRLFGDRRYLEAWEEIYRSELGTEKEPGQARYTFGDHGANKAVECFTWHQMHRWRARWEDGEVTLDPIGLEDEELQAVVATPVGPRRVSAQRA